MPLAWRRRAACRSPRQAANASRRPAADGAPQAAMAYPGRCSRSPGRSSVEARAETGLPVNAVTHLATWKMVANLEVLPSRTCRQADGAKAFISLNIPNPLKDLP